MGARKDVIKGSSMLRKSTRVVHCKIHLLRLILLWALDLSEKNKMQKALWSSQKPTILFLQC